MLDFPPFLIFRLSTSFEEVSVYPIPALLYLVKNLLQVNYIMLLIDVNLIYNAMKIMINLHSVVASITSLLMWMPLLTRY